MKEAMNIDGALGVPLVDRESGMSLGACSPTWSASRLRPVEDIVHDETPQAT